MWTDSFLTKFKAIMPAERAPVAAPQSGLFDYVRVATFKVNTTDANHWWQHAQNLSSGSASGIKEFLEAHLKSDASHAGRLLSVVIEVPQAFLNDDLIRGGGVIARIKQTLEANHANDLSKRSQGGRYAVRGGSGLGAQEIRVITGAAVHVPSADEPVAFHIEFSTCGTLWSAQPSLDLTRDHLSCVLGGHVERASFCLPAWPFGDSILAIVNAPDAQQPKLIAVDETLKVEHLPKDDVFKVSKLKPSAPMPALPGEEPGAAAPAGLAKPATAVPRHEPRLFVRARRISPAAVPAPVVERPAEPLPAPAAQPEAVVPPAPVSAPAAPVVPVPPVTTGARPLPTRVEPVFGNLAPAMPPVPVTPPSPPSPASRLDDEGTLTSSPKSITPAPQGLSDSGTLLSTSVAFSTLELVGLAVQRPSRFATSGVKGLQWGLDWDGRIVPPHLPTCETRFEVDEQDTIRVSTHGGSSVLPVGSNVAVCGGDAFLTLHAMPNALQDAYIAWLSLPAGQVLKLAADVALKVGRQMQAVLPLLPLAGPGFVPGLEDGNRMGVSSDHLVLELNLDRQLAVTPQEANRAVVLDAEGHYLAQIDASHPVLLEDGQHLLLGHYLWRFKA